MSPGAWRSQLIGILKRHKDVDQRNACDYGEHDRGGRVQQDGQERKPAHDKGKCEHCRGNAYDFAGETQRTAQPE